MKAFFSAPKKSQEFGWLVAIIIFSNILMYLLLTAKIDERPAQKSNAHRQNVQDSLDLVTLPEGFIIDSLRQAVKGRFKITISGNDNTVLSLIQNDTFVESITGKEQDFQFEEVMLQNGNNRFVVWGLNSAGQSYLVDSFSVNYKAPRINYLSNPVYRVRSKQKVVAFTFDGGSSNKGTQEILDILHAKNIQCTMFLTGQFVKRYPGLVKQILDDGHEIGNHSYNHPHFTNIEIDGSRKSRVHVNRNFLYYQLAKTDSIYYALISQNMKPYWRAPFGEINREILTWAAEMGYRHIGWSYQCDSWDWVADSASKFYRTPEEIKNHFLEIEEQSGLEGKIVLMHLGSERLNNYPYESLAALINALQIRGYTFVKISQLLSINS